MPTERWRERHGTCQFGTFKPATAEGWVVAGCQHPEVGERYNEHFCARDCPAYKAREPRPEQGRIPECVE